MIFKKINFKRKQGTNKNTEISFEELNNIKDFLWGLYENKEINCIVPLKLEEKRKLWLLFMQIINNEKVLIKDIDLKTLK